MQYQQQIVIGAAPSRVFSFMDDVTREAEWQPGIVEARKDPPGDTMVGTRKSYVSEFMGRRVKNTYVTTHFETDRRVVYEATPDSTLQARIDLDFESVDGGTRVTMTVRGKPAGPLRFIPKGILEGVFRKELESSLVLLRDLLEGRR